MENPLTEMLEGMDARNQACQGRRRLAVSVRGFSTSGPGGPKNHQYFRKWNGPIYHSDKKAERDPKTKKGPPK